jgi:hypothetical protein
MTNQQHPITPPPELVQQWWEEADQHVGCDDPETYFDYVATQAAQWGADQELEACCEWLHNTDVDDSQEAAKDLRAARRPKPPSLKEQALKALEHILHNSSTELGAETIRRALEQLDD